MSVPEALASVLITDFSQRPAEITDAMGIQALHYGIDFDWDLISKEEVSWFDDVAGMPDCVPDWVRDRYSDTGDAWPAQEQFGVPTIVYVSSDYYGFGPPDYAAEAHTAEGDH